jgi:hypothetical protein
MLWLRRSLVAAVALVGVPTLLCASATRAAVASDAGPWLTALGTAYVVVDLSTGDLDGDGRDETVVCYRENLATTNQSGGVAVYAGKGQSQKPLWHVQLDKTLCEKVRVNGRKLGLLLANNKQLVLTYGEEIHFRGTKGSAIKPKSVKASSTAGSQHAPEKAFDNDLSTSWAEGADGTGIGQFISVRLEKATDIGAIGIYCGDGSNKRSFFDRNRVHRGSIEAKTDADLGDTEAGFDFASLGIDAIGDRVEFSCENRPEITYVPFNKRGVVELEVRIESVYLGDKKDDTHIAEIEIVPRLLRTQTVDKASPARPVAASASAGDDEEDDDDGKGSDVDVDRATSRLDGEGRGIAIDDDL